MARQETGEETSVELGGVAIVDSDLGGAQCVNELADEVENLRFLFLG